MSQARPSLMGLDTSSMVKRYCTDFVCCQLIEASNHGDGWSTKSRKGRHSRIGRNAILAKIVLRILCSMLERKMGKCLMTMSSYPRNIIGGGSSFPVQRVNEVLWYSSEQRPGSGSLLSTFWTNIEVFHQAPGVVWSDFLWHMISDN